MANPNTSPTYTATPDVSNNNGTGMGQAMTAAAADYTGISANYVLEHTAGANGSYVERLRFKALGTNVAAVARIFINNGSTPGTAANNTFYGEVTLAATTASTTAGTVEIDYPMNVRLPPGFRIYVGLGASVAAGWNCVAVAGQY
jgi:hypothetical protein